MIHRCPNCPGHQNLKDHLSALFSDRDNEDLVHFQQWQTTDRAELSMHCLPVDEFTDLLVQKLDELTVHSFIAKSQSVYMKQRKNDLREDESLCTADFAEKYQYIIQDEIQSAHWSKQSLTIHPAVLYVKSEK